MHVCEKGYPAENCRNDSNSIHLPLPSFLSPVFSPRRTSPPLLCEMTPRKKERKNPPLMPELPALIEKASPVSYRRATASASPS